MNKTDSKNTVHDELQIWLSEDRIQEKIIEKFCFPVLGVENRKIEIIHEPGDIEHLINTWSYGKRFIDLRRKWYYDDPVEYGEDFKQEVINYYEIKISEQSTGEILRQLNVYYSGFKPKPQEKVFFFVVCEDDSWLLKYKNVIEDNGWKIITPTDIR